MRLNEAKNKILLSSPDLVGIEESIFLQYFIEVRLTSGLEL